MQHCRALVTGKDHLAPKQLVLSFDDGPNNITTPLLLRAETRECARVTRGLLGLLERYTCSQRRICVGSGA